MLSQSYAEKSEANDLFRSAQYSQAISVYDRALASVPNYLEYEIAVLKSNIAACHVKLLDWKAAIDEATKSIEALDRFEGPPATAKEKNTDAKGASHAEPSSSNDDEVVELADGEEDEGEALKKIQEDDKRKEDIRRIRIKALMRRARARSEQGDWGNLQGALEGTSQICSALFHPSSYHTHTPLIPSNRLPTPLHLSLCPPSRQNNHQYRSTHPPATHSHGQGERNGRDDGQVEGVGEWDFEAFWAVD